MTANFDNYYEGSSVTSLSLLERARCNDPYAWERLRDLYVPLVYRWCRYRGIQPSDVLDIGQEVFFAVARGIKGFQREREGQSFRAWLRVITHSKIRDFYRKRKRELDVQCGSQAQKELIRVPFEDNKTEKELTDREEIRVLYEQAVAIVSCEYPRWYKPAFEQLVMEERSPLDVAAEFGVRISAVYNAKARILKRLRDEFAELVI